MRNYLAHGLGDFQMVQPRTGEDMKKQAILFLLARLWIDYMRRIEAPREPERRLHFK